MEDSYDADYLSNIRGDSSVDKEQKNLLEILPTAPIKQRGTEGAVHIDTEISPTVSVLGDSESVSRDIYRDLQDKEKEVQYKEQSTSFVMKSGAQRRLKVINVGASDDGAAKIHPPSYHRDHIGARPRYPIK